MAFSPQKILVVDNHPLILHFMLETLEKQGHEVTAAEDALSALHLLRDLRPDVIFIDLIMPRISGDQFCRILRSKPEFQNTYLIILSAIAAEEQTDFAAFGADACIAKGPLANMSTHIQDVLRRVDSKTLRRNEPEIIGLEGVYQRQITRELLSSKRRFESILAHIAEGILEITDKGQIIYANPIAQKILGLPEEQLLAANFCDIFPQEQQKPFTASFDKETGDRGHLTRDSMPYGDKIIELALLPVAEKDFRSTLVVLRDISSSLQMKNALRESEEKYRLLFHEMINGFMYFKIIADENGAPCDYRFLEVNSAFESMTGRTTAEVLGKTINELLPEDGPVLNEQFDRIAKGKHLRFEHFCIQIERHFEFACCRPEKDRLAVILNDINDRKRLEERLHEASITDELTGILNRRGFITLAEKQLKIAAREGSSLYLLFADFDDLKTINDEMGHQAGDQALMDTAAILQTTFRESDIIGRLGGDEFAILLTGPPGADNEQSILARLEKNLHKSNDPDHIGELSVSCGLVRFDPQAPCTLDELIYRADQQMYQLKRSKKKERN